MKSILTISFWGIAIIACAQDGSKKTADSALNYLQLNEVVISANRFSALQKNTVQQITVINAANISRVNSQNTGDLLIGTGKVFVQKSQPYFTGGGWRKNEQCNLSLWPFAERNYSRPEYVRAG
jgi:hypothetical protein